MRRTGAGKYDRRRRWREPPCELRWLWLARPRLLEPTNRTVQRRVPPGNNVGSREWHHLVGNDASPLDARAVRRHEVRDHVHEHIARREPSGHGGKRLPRRPLAEHAGTT